MSLFTTITCEESEKVTHICAAIVNGGFIKQICHVHFPVFITLHLGTKPRCTFNRIYLQFVASM